MNIEVIDIVEALKIVSKKDDIKQSDDNKIGNIGNFIVYKTKHFTDIRGTTYGKSEDNVARTKGVTKQDMIDVITKFLSIKHITIEDIGKEYEIIYKKNDLYNKLPIAIQANYNPNKISIVLKTIIAHNRPSPNNYNHNANQERVVI
jgi:hypothetical protein